jgi:hypothetical protein
MTKQEEQVVQVPEVTAHKSSFLGYVNQFISLVNPAPMADEALGDRMITLATGKVIFGMVVAESSDSFLVLYPVGLARVKEDSEVFGKLFSTTPQARVLKSSVVMISEVDDEHRYHYFKFIVDQEEKASKLFDKQHWEKIVSVVGNYKSTPRSTRPSNPSQEDGGDMDSYLQPLSFHKSKVRH